MQTFFQKQKNKFLCIEVSIKILMEISSAKYP